MHAAQPSICASAHACFCMAARLHMQTAAPASARAHRCAGMTAVQACVRGGRTATLSPAFWCCQPGPGRWYRSAAGAGGCSSIPRTPWYGSLRAFVLGNGDVPRCGRVSSHVCLPELQGAGRQLEEAWLQAGGAEGQQGTGFWGETASRWDYCCQHCEAVILALGIYTACSQRDAC